MQRINKDFDEFEVRPRHGSHQWLSELNKVEGLPVKENGSIKQRYKQSNNQQDNDENVDNSDNEEMTKKEKITKKKKEEEEEDEDDDIATTISKRIKAKSLEECKTDIAAICISATTYPEKSLQKTKKNKNNIDDDGDEVHYLPEIFQYMLHPNPKVVKVSILSALLVFKDIIPGYRVRTLNENSSKVAIDTAGLQLKKETKRLQDHELAVVRVYRRYINFLEEVIHKKQPLYHEALRCECELIKAVSHFNYRNMLLHTIIGVAAGIEQAAVMCRETMTFLFKNDKNADLSYEMVLEMNKVFASTKYNLDDEFVRY
jgi:nucleolar complex protein 3